MYIIKETYETKIEDIMQAIYLFEHIKARKEPKFAQCFILKKMKLIDEETGEIINEYKRL